MTKQNFGEINKMKPFQAYAKGYDEGWNKVCSNFWTILENLYNEGKINDEVIKRFGTLGTLHK